MLGDKSQSGKVHFIVYLDGVSKDGLLDIMPQGSTNLKTIIDVGRSWNNELVYDHRIDYKYLYTLWLYVSYLIYFRNAIRICYSSFYITKLLFDIYIKITFTSNWSSHNTCISWLFIGPYVLDFNAIWMKIFMYQLKG